jgi:hypothetical protein
MPERPESDRGVVVGDLHNRVRDPYFLADVVLRFIAPLTSGGRELVRLISELQDSFSDQLHAPPGVRVAQEGLVQMVFTPSHYVRIPLIRRFSQLVADRIVWP